MSEIISTLTGKGYVESTEEILDAKLSYYFLTDINQSLVFKRALISLPKTYADNINDPIAFTEKVESELENEMKKYFEMVEVKADAKFLSGENKADVAVYISVIDSSGNKVGLGKVTRLSETGITRVINISNYGDRHKYLGV